MIPGRRQLVKIDRDLRQKEKKEKIFTAETQRALGNKGERLLG